MSSDSSDDDRPLARPNGRREFSHHEFSGFFSYPFYSSFASSHLPGSDPEPGQPSCQLVMLVPHAAKTIRAVKT